MGDQEIFVTKSREDSDFILETEPPVCDECVLQREKQEEDKQLVYRNVTVYVRRLTGSEKFPEKDNSDPDYDMFGKMNGNSKRKNEQWTLCNKRKLFGGFCQEK